MEYRKKPEKPPEYVKRRCHRCNGAGRAPCAICGGRGQVMQGTDVRGNISYATCTGCFGSRSLRCGHCSGEGFV